MEIKENEPTSTKADSPLARAKKDTSISLGLELCACDSGPAVSEGGKGTLGLGIPSASQFSCGLREVDTNGGWDSDLLSEAWQVLTAHRCFQSAFLSVVSQPT